MFWDTGEQLTKWEVDQDITETVDLPNTGKRTLWITLPSKDLAACTVNADEKAVTRNQKEDPEERQEEVKTENQVIVWSYPQWKELVRLDHPSPIDAVRFNSDGSRLLSLTRDGTMRLWDWKEKKTLAIIRTSGISAFSFLDDQRIATLQHGQLLTYSSWEPEKLREEVCDRVRHNLTLAEWRSFSWTRQIFLKRSCVLSTRRRSNGRFWSAC